MQTEISSVNEFSRLWLGCRSFFILNYAFLKGLAPVHSGFYVPPDLADLKLWLSPVLNRLHVCCPTPVYVRAALPFSKARSSGCSSCHYYWIQLPAPQAPSDICSLHWLPDKWGVCFSLADQYLLEGQWGWFHQGKWTLLILKDQ